MRGINSLAVLVATVALSGCLAADTGPFSLVGFYAPNQCDTVDPEKSPQIMRGSVDVNAASGYAVAVSLKTNITSGGSGSDLTVSGTILESSERDYVVIDSMEVNYTSVPALPKVKGNYMFTRPLAGYFSSKGTFNTNRMNILGPEIVQALNENVEPRGDEYLVTATIVFKGHMSRQANAVSSGPYSFPIRVYKTGVTCPRPKGLLACAFASQDTGSDTSTANLCCSCATADACVQANEAGCVY